MAVDGKNIQYYGGTTEQHKTYTAPSRAISVDTSKNVLVIHDGATPGGHPLASAAMEIDAAEPLSIISGGNLGENTEIGLNISADEKNILRVQDGGLLASRDELADMWGIHRNIGDLVYSTLPQINDKSLHLLDGSVLARADYVDLFALIDELYKDGSYDNLFMSEADWQTSVTAYGVCGKFVYDEAAATLRLPKVTGFVEGTLDTAALGDLTEAGLPNITGGKIGGRIIGDEVEWTGAFSKTTIGSNSSVAGGSGGLINNNSLQIDASLSNPIYGNSDTVQPQSVKVYIYMVVANRFESAVSKVDELTELIQNLSMVNPAGTVIAFAGNSSSAPAGYLLCNGAAISRTTYATLYAAIGDIYGAGDGSTTFNLPDMTDKFIQGSGTAGTVKAAGLPNVEGTLGFPNFRFPSEPSVTGAYYKRSGTPSGARLSGAGSYTDWHFPGFDASLSNSIYGNSDTVQPPALTMRYCIKY